MLRGLAYAPVEIDALADVVDGPVSSTLANLPERTDLLVIGSRGYRFMRRILLGGMSARWCARRTTRWWSYRADGAGSRPLYSRRSTATTRPSTVASSPGIGS